MALNICMMVLLMFLNSVVADDNANKDILVYGKAFFIIGIAFMGSFLIVFLTGFAYFGLKYMKKTMSEPQYCIDDTISNKGGSEFYAEKNDDHSQVPQLHQIQPILTVSEVISSVKQSLEDLDAALRPSNWSRVQRIYNQENPADEKIDFSV